MDVKQKEIEGASISLRLDRSNYKKLISEIKKIGKELEYKSNPNNLKYSAYINMQKTPYMKVKGWCSRCVDDDGKTMEVFFADYDNILYRIVQDEVRYLMWQFDMPPFYIFTTSETKDENGEVYGNYLIVCLKKQSYREVVSMQNELHCDAAYKKIALLYRFKTWVLRLGPKGKKPAPKFKEVIGDLNAEYYQDVSQPHLEALEEIYPEIPKINYVNKDGRDISKLFVTEYTTASI